MRKGTILFLLLVFTLLTGCNTFESNLNNDCEEWAESLIPNIINLNFNILPGPVSESFTWNDDQEVLYPNKQYRKGEKVGENINYYYPYYITNDKLIYDNYFFYSKKVIDNRGKIEKENKFAVILILEQMNNSSFNVVEKRFLNCVN